LLPSIAWAAIDIFPHRLTAISTAVGLPEIILASAVGAALYKE
jgi:hypothetical protein